MSNALGGSDYALPRADGCRRPLFERAACAEGPGQLLSDGQPLGVKGAGQPDCIAAPPTILKAILDALASLGIDHIDMPASAERVWRPCGAPSRTIRSARAGRRRGG